MPIPLPTVASMLEDARSTTHTWCCGGCPRTALLCLPGLVIGGHGGATVHDLKRQMRCAACGQRGIGRMIAAARNTGPPRPRG